MEKKTPKQIWERQQSWWGKGLHPIVVDALDELVEKRKIKACSVDTFMEGDEKLYVACSQGFPKMDQIHDLMDWVEIFRQRIAEFQNRISYYKDQIKGLLKDEENVGSGFVAHYYTEIKYAESEIQKEQEAIQTIKSTIVDLSK